jgi:hypothetical protein
MADTPDTSGDNIADALESVLDMNSEEYWRYLCLGIAGYTHAQATQLAQSNADLHDAVELVTERDCPHALALDILL